MSLTELLKQADPQSIDTGHRVFSRGQTAKCVYYLLQGRVGLGLFQGEQAPHRLSKMVAPGWLDLSAAVLDQPMSYDAVAETPLVVKRVPLREFQAWLAQQTVSTRDLIHDLALGQRQMTELSVSRLAMDAQARCAEWLLEHAQPIDRESMAVQFTQRKRQIAEQLGIAPETLSRVLRDLRERGFIRGRGRVLDVVDPTGLRHLVGA
ncbi:MAG: Crp/Fnr family transcriptional regulator [Limnohabitans sp.]|jgi:CRP-like cAMP-binding protein|nr:Crp/Fnr family transcriptional regulator [Limnohabitans sp.]